MNISEIAIRRPVLTTMVTLFMMVLGLVGIKYMGVDLFPDVSFPVVVITTPAKLREQRRRVTRDDRDQRLLPDKEKLKRADFAYVNKGTLEELDAWVTGVMQELTK